MMEKVFRCKDLPVFMQPKSGYVMIKKCWRKLAQSVLTLAITSVFLIMGTDITCAELIEEYLISPGDALITRDTVTGLEWLDVTQTANRSFNEISTKFGVGQEFAGFRYATVEEVTVLFTNAGITVLEGSSSENFVPVTELLELTGTLYGTTFFSGFFAITADIPEGLYHYMSNIQIKLFSEIAWAEPIAALIPDTLSDRWPDDTARFDVGSWLVRSSTEPEPPVAHAGSDQIVQLWTNVYLDGSLSSDPENSTLFYEWEIVSKPAESDTTLSDAAYVNPSFTTDFPGDYVIELVVTNSFGLSSAPSTVYIEAISFEDVVTYNLEDMMKPTHSCNHCWILPVVTMLSTRFSISASISTGATKLQKD